MLWRKIRQGRRKGSAVSGGRVVILHRLCSVIQARAGEGLDQSDSEIDGEKRLESG